MKILHVETGRHLYGGALQVFYLLRGLKELGCTNVLVCPKESAIGAAARDLCDPVHGIAMRGDLDLAFIARLRRIIRAEQPDLVHLHSRRGADTLGGIAARLAGARVILTRRVDNPERRSVVALKYRMYHRIITISEGIRDVLLAEGVPGDKVTCVHSAVDTSQYTQACDPDWFRAEFDLEPSQRVLGVIAQYIPRKGHRYLFAALPDILARHPDVKILLFGKGPLEEELRGLAAAPNLRGHIQLCGFRPDLARVLPCLYAVVHPADMEGLGVSLLQAAAAGIPLIATAAGGIPEIVRDGVNGRLVPPRDATALAAAIDALLSDPGLARSMGAAGRHIVEQEFSIDAMVHGNLEIYQQLLALRTVSHNS